MANVTDERKSVTKQKQICQSHGSGEKETSKKMEGQCKEGRRVDCAEKSTFKTGRYGDDSYTPKQIDIQKPYRMLVV